MASTVWRGYLSFGLISIPVRLFRAARAEKISFRRLYRRETPGETAPAAKTFASSKPSAEDPVSVVEEPQRSEPFLTPVQQVSVRKGSDEVLPGSSVVKGYEYDKDRFVSVEPEELKILAPKTSAAMQIEEFVQLSEIDPVYFETSYYVTPEEAGEKAYALLYRALQLTGLVAIAQFAMHGREHVVVLRAGRTGLLGHTMFYASEVRAEEEYRADTRAVNAKELELAQTLIHSLAAPFEPAKYRDAYRERLESMLAKKVEGQPVPLVSSPRQAAVVDIADALRRSLASIKEPAASEKPADKIPRRARKAPSG